MTGRVDAAVARAVEALQTFEVEDARTVRLRVLEHIMALAGADIGGFYNFVEDHEGRLRVGTYVAIGGPEADVGFRIFADRPELLAGSPFTDARRSRPEETAHFMEDSALVSAEAMERSPLYQVAYKAAGMRWQQRLRVVHGRRIVGRVGVMRRIGAPSFRRADRVRMQPLVAPVVSAILFADACEKSGLPEGPAVVLARADGWVEHASDGAARWLALPSFAERLRHVVTAFDRGRGEAAHAALDIADAHVVRLDGVGGVRYAVMLRAAPPALLAPDAVLSPRLREVAGCAATGSTVQEIARHVGRSPNTVSAQLREVYRRLGVSDRVGLRRALEVRDEGG